MKYLTKKQLFWNVLLLSALGCFSLYFTAEFSDYSEQHQRVVFTLRNCIAAMLFFNCLGLFFIYIHHCIRRDQYLYMRKFWQVAAFFIVTALFVLVLNYLLIAGTRCIMKFDSPFWLTTASTKSLFVIWLIELVIVSLSFVANFYRNLVELYKRTVELEESDTKRRYQALQNQLNPHFLFNSLNTLVAEIEYDPKVAVKFTCNLSDVYRYILQCQNKRTVSLREEFSFMEAYIFLHIVRMGRCIWIDKQIPEDILDSQLPPLTLQLLAENIVKHNVISMSKPMQVEIYVEADNQRLCVSNQIQPKQGVAPSGKGLDNLRERYRLLKGKEIVVEKNDNRFIVKVPLFYE